MKIDRYIVWPALSLATLTLLSVGALVFLPEDEGTGLPGGIWTILVMVPANLALFVLDAVACGRGPDWGVWMGYLAAIIVNALIGGCLGALWRTMRKEEVGQRWNYKQLLLSLAVGVFAQSVVLPLVGEDLRAGTMNFALAVDVLVAVRILLAFLMRTEGRGWVFYVVLCYSSPVWMSVVAIARYQLSCP